MNSLDLIGFIVILLLGIGVTVIQAKLTISND